MTLAMINLQTGETDNLLPWSYEIKGFPVLKGDTVYFSAGSGYQDDIFAVDIKTKNLFKLTNEPLGAYQPAINNTGKVSMEQFYSDRFTAKGKTVESGRLATPDEYSHHKHA